MCTVEWIIQIKKNCVTKESVNQFISSTSIGFDVDAVSRRR